MCRDIKLRRTRWVLICLFALVSSAWSNTHAALQAFIRFQDPKGGALAFQGSSTDAQFPGSQGWSEISYFNAAMDHMVSLTTLAGKAQIEPFYFAKAVDSGSPALFKTCATGGHYGDV